MPLHFCPEVQAWFTMGDHAIIASVPSTRLCTHVAACRHCRTALRHCANALLFEPLDEATSSCDQCQADLAAYIDIERDEGTSAALQALPHVWWHLWLCVTCAETYLMVVTLQQAEARAILPPIPLLSLVRGDEGEQPR